MKILVICEDQSITSEFRRLGHEAYSAGQEFSGSHPEWHFGGNPLVLINGKQPFFTLDGKLHNMTTKWDLLIANPSGQFLACSGNRWFNTAKYGRAAEQRKEMREKAVENFLKLTEAECDHICIINPVGVMSTRYRRPDQIVQPYYFGDPERAARCLWLKGLSCLVPTDSVMPEIILYKNRTGTDSPWHMNTLSLPNETRRKVRSRGFKGMSKAIAEQFAFQCAPTKTQIHRKKAA